jgi:hypothetical protein
VVALWLGPEDGLQPCRSVPQLGFCEDEDVCVPSAEIADYAVSFIPEPPHIVCHNVEVLVSPSGIGVGGGVSIVGRGGSCMLGVVCAFTGGFLQFGWGCVWSAIVVWWWLIR